MQFSKELINRYNLAKTGITINDVILKIEDIIKLNTPEFLHERISQKIANLNFDIDLTGKSAEYKHETNTVVLNLNYIDDFNVYLHEIMHAIGTEYFNSVLNVGLNKRFSKKVADDKHIAISFGFGANEGLNQHYTENFIRPHFPVSEVSPEYSFCANIMGILENLVGADKMKNAHFSGMGADKLIYEIVNQCHLPNDNKALKLLMQLDIYKNVARTHIVFGAFYSPDVRTTLSDAYKTLISIALIKAKKENRDILLNDIINFEHLNENNVKYFSMYMMKDLVSYFYKEKEYVNNKTGTNFVGITYKPFIENIFRFVLDYIKTNQFDGKNLPEEFKCGEFFNFIMSDVFLADDKKEEYCILTNDMKKELTVAIFDSKKNMMPNKESERIQLIKQILSTRTYVRCGAEVSDEYIIEATSDEDFNIYLMDAIPQYYKEIFVNVSPDAKKNPMLVEKMLSDVFMSRFDLYKFKKNMPKEILEQEDIAKLLDKFKVDEKIKGQEK